MAGIFQTNTGYRDPAKSMTIKALEARMKAAQETAASAQQMQQPISDPWQGAGYLANILAGQVNQRSAENADINARDQLAKIKAGIDWTKGPDATQYADMSRLDPEGADKIMQDWVNYRQDMEKQTKQNEFTTSERTGTEGYQTGEHVRQEGAQEVAAVAEDARSAAQKVTDEQAKRDAIGKDADARMAEGQKLGLTGEDLQRYAATGNMPVQQDKFNTPQGMEQINKWNQQVGQYDSALNNFDRALQLTDQIPDALLGDLQLEGAKIVSQAGPMGVEAVMPLIQKLPGMQNVTAQQVNALMEYDRIVGLNAMTNMSQTLKGQSTDREMAAFLQRMAAGSMGREERKRMINNLMTAIKTDRDFTGVQLKSQGINVDPYVGRTQSQPQPDPNTATPAPDLSNASQDDIDAAIRRGPGR